MNDRATRIINFLNSFNYYNCYISTDRSSHVARYMQKVTNRPIDEVQSLLVVFFKHYCTNTKEVGAKLFERLFKLKWEDHKSQIEISFLEVNINKNRQNLKVILKNNLTNLSDESIDETLNFIKECQQEWLVDYFDERSHCVEDLIIAYEIEMPKIPT